MTRLNTPTLALIITINDVKQDKIMIINSYYSGWRRDYNAMKFSEDFENRKSYLEASFHQYLLAYLMEL